MVQEQWKESVCHLSTALAGVADSIINDKDDLLVFMSLYYYNRQLIRSLVYTQDSKS
jgi:hypothetical protein